MASSKVIATASLALLILSFVPWSQAGVVHRDPDISSPDIAPAGGRWTQAKPLLAPKERTSHAMAYDPASGRVVVFGGASPDLLNDTWLYDLANDGWTEVTPAVSPSPRMSSEMVSIGNGRLLLYGGGSGTSIYDTWIYDVAGNKWTPYQTSKNPGERMDYGLAFDRNAGKVIMFGGFSGGAYSDETWTLDPSGGSWEKIAPTNSPPARRNFPMVWDPSSGRTVLFGGMVALKPAADTWFFDSSAGNWLHPTPPTSPAARAGSALSAGTGLGGVLLFGGEAEGEKRMADTWVYDVKNNTWTEDKVLPSPNGRMGHKLAHHDALRRTVLFAGGPGTQQNDTWVYDPAPTGPAVPQVLSTSPPDGASRVDLLAEVRVEFNVDMDPSSTAAAFSTSPMVAGGGAAVSGRILRWNHSSPFAAPATYTVTVSTAAKSAGGVAMAAPHTSKFSTAQTIGRWVDASPASAPPARTDPAIGCDPVSGSVVLFGGGVVPAGGAMDDTWSYDISGNSWSKSTGGPAPPARRGHAIVAVGDGRLLMFGGIAGSGTLSDTWLFDTVKKEWSAGAAAGPTPRSYHGMALVDGGKRVLLYGGWDGSTALGDIWSYDVAGDRWTKQPDIPGPDPRYSHAMTSVPTSGEAVVHGGQVGLQPNDETWHYSPLAHKWTKQSPSVSPGKRSRHVAVFDGVSGELMAYGGDDRVEGLDARDARGAAGLFNDTWHYRPSSPAWADQSPVPNPGPTTDYAMCYDAITGKTVFFGGEESSVVGETWLYSTGSPTPAAPRVLSTSPASGTTGVALAAAVVVNFSVEMEPTATPGSFAISPSVSGGSASVSGRSLVWTHTSPYAANTEYTVTIGTAAKSSAGIALPAAKQFVFLTAAVPTGSPPKVTSTQPSDGEIGISLASPVFVIFDREMDPATTAAAFSIDPAPVGVVNVSGAVLKFVASADLPALTKHTVKVGPGARGSNGVALGSEFEFSFTTKEKAPPTPGDTAGPGDGSRILGLDYVTFSIIAGALVAAAAVAAVLLVRRRGRPPIEEQPVFFEPGR